MLTIGFLLNPYAGIGGPMALKGSDNLDIDKLLQKGGECLASRRAAMAIEGLQPLSSDIRWITAPTVMGEDLLSEQGFSFEVVGHLDGERTSAADTESFIQLLVQQGVDLLLFVGGDGTARNVVNALGSCGHEQQLSLGVPAGVKMHSGVYTVSPKAATTVLSSLIKQEPVSTALQEVRDIDEQALREGKLNSRYYGELLVPNDHRYVQQVKNTCRQNEEELQLDIAAGVVDDMEDDTLYIVGCGTTPKAVMDELGLENTLLGIDVVLGRQCIAEDVTAAQLQGLLEQYPYHNVKLLITAIGGQGHIIGRGNQQLSADVLLRIGKDNTLVLLTPTKLEEFEQRPLLIDSGDAALDQQWSGLIKLYTGYQQTVVYPLNGGQ